MTETCESCGMARHGYGLNGCVNQLLHEAMRLHVEGHKARAENQQLRAAVRAYFEPEHLSAEEEYKLRQQVLALISERKHGPRSACPECGMGGDVGADTPNPIPF